MKKISILLMAVMVFFLNHAFAQQGVGIATVQFVYDPQWEVSELEKAESDGFITQKQIPPGAGADTLEATLMYFEDTLLDIGKVLSMMNDLELRPATSTELIALGGSFPISKKYDGKPMVMLAEVGSYNEEWQLLTVTQTHLRGKVVKRMARRDVRPIDGVWFMALPQSDDF
jgi:hypothetical protein